MLQTYFQYPDTLFFFDFVVDPNTFLHICLIIRYGFIRIRLDQDDISVIESTNINKGGKGIDLNTQVRNQRAITLQSALRGCWEIQSPCPFSVKSVKDWHLLQVELSIF